MEINQVFTPRSSQPNLKIYVPRLNIEDALHRCLLGSMHGLLFGESGNGKSWLYKKVLQEKGIPFRLANCANAAREGSLTAEICNALLVVGSSEKKTTVESKDATVRAIVADGKLGSATTYNLQTEEPLLRAFREFRNAIKNDSVGVLVLDNLESIFDSQDLMKELANIVLLLDDDRYAAYRIKLLIVGVPNGVLEYFERIENASSVANRIEELPKVNSLNAPGVKTIVKTGFNEMLGFGFSPDDIQVCGVHVHEVTLGVAQRVHEYCEKLAYQIETSRKAALSRPSLAEHIRAADTDWLRVGLRHAYTVVEAHLNNRRTTIARRNQVIYCLAKIKIHQFDAKKMEDLIRQEFPMNVSANMGVSAILNDLSTGSNPMLKKTLNTSDFRVADPRYIMCIRTVLMKDEETGNVSKKSFAL